MNGNDNPKKDFLKAVSGFQPTGDVDITSVGYADFMFPGKVIKRYLGAGKNVRIVVSEGTKIEKNYYEELGAIVQVLPVRYPNPAVMQPGDWVDDATVHKSLFCSTISRAISLSNHYIRGQEFSEYDKSKELHVTAAIREQELRNKMLACDSPQVMIGKDGYILGDGDKFKPAEHKALPVGWVPKVYLDLQAGDTASFFALADA
jgi:hypothetical protein